MADTDAILRIRADQLAKRDQIHADYLATGDAEAAKTRMRELQIEGLAAMQATLASILSSTLTVPPPPPTTMQCVPFDPDCIWWMFMCKDLHSGYTYALLLDTASTSQVAPICETLTANPALAQQIQLALSFPTARSVFVTPEMHQQLPGKWCLFENNGRHVARVLGHSLLEYHGE